MVKKAALGTWGPKRERTSFPVGSMARDVKLVVNVTFCFLVNRHGMSIVALAIEIRYPRVRTSRRNVEGTASRLPPPVLLLGRGW